MNGCCRPPSAGGNNIFVRHTSESMSSSTPSLRQIMAEIKQYLSLQFEWVKLDSVEKLTRIVSMLAVMFISIFLVAGIFIYLSLAAVYLLAPHFGMILSFVMISGIFFVLLLLVWILRTPLIVNPVLRFFYKLFIPQKENDDENELPAKTDEP